MKPSVPSKEELKEKLTPEQWKVTQQEGTEYPFQNAYYQNKKTGTYNCVCCGESLFSSDAKFDSGSGWPSFYRALDKEKIYEKKDTTHGMVRVAVECKNCNAHLGHVFDDVSAAKGQRYCINSASLDFTEKK